MFTMPPNILLLPGGQSERGTRLTRLFYRVRVGSIDRTFDEQLDFDWTRHLPALTATTETGEDPDLFHGNRRKWNSLTGDPVTVPVPFECDPIGRLGKIKRTNNSVRAGGNGDHSHTHTKTQPNQHESEPCKESV